MIYIVKERLRKRSGKSFDLPLPIHIIDQVIHCERLPGG